MPPKTRTDPNVHDPIGETTIGRRVWASYLQRGYTRFSFAKTLGVSYSTVDAWDQERSTPSLEMLLRIVELLEVPLAAIVYGHSGVPTGATHPQGLSREARIALMNELDATPTQRSAFARHEDSLDGRYQTYTRGYMVQWLAAYAAALKAGKSEAEANHDALQAATSARAVIGAVDSGITRTATRDEVRTIVRPPTTKTAKPGKRVRKR